MHIRKTVESDAEALSHMMIASWCDTYSSILSNAKLDEICTIWLTPEKFLERARNIDAVNFVAMHEDVIVGHIFAEFTQASSLHIEPPWVYWRVKLSKDRPYDTEKTHPHLYS